MKEKRYTYPRVMFEREMISNEEGTPAVAMTFVTIVITRNNTEQIVQLSSFYPFFGKRDIEIEMDSANIFHEMCRAAYFDDNEEDENTNIDTPSEGDITFDENDERW
jgi:hypothetical protein